MKNTRYTLRNFIVVTAIDTIRFVKRSLFEIKYHFLKPKSDEVPQWLLDAAVEEILNISPVEKIAIKLYVYAEELASILQCNYAEWTVLREINGVVHGDIIDQSRVERVYRILNAPNPFSYFTDALVDAGDILSRKVALHQAAIHALIQAKTPELHADLIV